MGNFKDLVIHSLTPVLVASLLAQPSAFAASAYSASEFDVTAGVEQLAATTTPSAVDYGAGAVTAGAASLLSFLSAQGYKKIELAVIANFAELEKTMWVDPLHSGRNAPRVNHELLEQRYAPRYIGRLLVDDPGHAGVRLLLSEISDERLGRVLFYEHLSSAAKQVLRGAGLSSAAVRSIKDEVSRYLLGKQYPFTPSVLDLHKIFSRVAEITGTALTTPQSQAVHEYVGRAQKAQLMQGNEVLPESLRLELDSFRQRPVTITYLNPTLADHLKIELATDPNAPGIQRPQSFLTNIRGRKILRIEAASAETIANYYAKAESMAADVPNLQKHQKFLRRLGYTSFAVALLGGVVFGYELMVDNTRQAARKGFVPAPIEVKP